MMEGFLLFAIAFVASLLGSLQAGPVNLAVLHTTLRQGQRAGLRVAVGGSLPELLYAGLAAAGGERRAVGANKWFSGAGRTYGPGDARCRGVVTA